MTFKRAVSVDSLWDGEKTGVVIDGKKVLLVHLGGDFYAYEDRCAHLGVELSRGCLRGQVLICSAHHWEYDLCSGKGINPPSAVLKALPVKLIGNDIFVDVGG